MDSKTSSRPTPDTARTDYKRSLIRILAIGGTVWAVASFSHCSWPSLDTDALLNVADAMKPSRSPAPCAQVDPLIPTRNGAVWDSMLKTVGSEELKGKAIKWLSGAVQVPTESYDGMKPVGEDTRWAAFQPFHDYLSLTFPRVHDTLSLAKVNTYGLLYEWTGTDKSLKPLLLMAHQDVVPVDPKTVDQWTHPPYSGFFDGKRIWGRGSADDKSGLIGSLGAIETLIEAGFKPRRTIVLAYGFDEESSGYYGAGHLAEAMLEIYGENAFAMIVDEGQGFSERYGTVFAMPAIAEKGYLDVRVSVSAPGGHSSVPPSHTSIGILSALLVQYEKSPYSVKLAKSSPLYSAFQCVAEYGKNVPNDLRKAIKNAPHSQRAFKKLEKFITDDLVYTSLVATTQAIDLIGGGVKVNALPESAWAVVNHRISIDSSIKETIERDTATLRPIAKKLNVTFTSFDTLIHEGDPARTLTLSDAFDNALAPAPVTPTEGSNAAPYRLLAGTIKTTYNTHRNLTGGDNIFVAPGMSTGNTDTRFMWKLSPHIFRYNHDNGGKEGEDLLGNIHTVNESIAVDAFFEMIRFFATLVLNVDEAVDI